MVEFIPEFRRADTQHRGGFLYLIGCSLEDLGQVIQTIETPRTYESGRGPTGELFVQTIIGEWIWSAFWGSIRSAAEWKNPDNRRMGIPRSDAAKDFAHLAGRAGRSLTREGAEKILRSGSGLPANSPTSLSPRSPCEWWIWTLVSLAATEVTVSRYAGGKNVSVHVINSPFDASVSAVRILSDYRPPASLTIPADPPADPRERINFDEAECKVRLDDTWHIVNENAFTLLKACWASYPMPAYASHQDGDVRPSRVKHSLPRQLKAIFRSDKGKGCWLEF